MSETWLNSDIKDSELQINNFQLFRSDRIGKSHGGVAFYIRDDMDCELVTNHSTGNCELVVVKIKINKETYFLTNIYRPPGSQISEFSNILAKVKDCDELMI